MNKPKSAIGYHLFHSKHELAAAVVEAQDARWVELGASIEEPAGLEHLITMLLSSCIDAARHPITPGAVRLIHESMHSERLTQRAYSWRAFTRLQLSSARGAVAEEKEIAYTADLVLSATFGVMWAGGYTPHHAPDTVPWLRQLWTAILMSADFRHASEIVSQAVPLEAVPAPYVSP